MQPAASEDESPTLAFLRAKKGGGGGLNAGSNHSVPFKPEVEPSMHVFPGDEMMNFEVLANDGDHGDDGSINPLDAFDPDQDLLLSGADADLVDLALRSPDHSHNHSVSTGFHDSAASGLSLGGFHDDEELLRQKEQLRQETMQNLNASMSSLNDAFERLTASMDRTNKTREMLKQFEGQQNPLEELRKDAALTGIAPTPSITGVAIGTGSRRRRMQRSGSNSSLNSLGSRGSRGSIGGTRKSRDKTARKLGRNIKSDLKSELRSDLTRSRSNSRGSLGRMPRSGSNRSLNGMPDQIIVTGV